MYTLTLIRNIFVIGLLIAIILGCSSSLNRENSTVNSAHGIVLATILPDRLIKVSVNGDIKPTRIEYRLKMPSTGKLPIAFGWLSGPCKNKFAVHLGNDIAIGELPEKETNTIELRPLMLSVKIGTFMSLSPDGRFIAYTRVKKDNSDIMPSFIGDLIVRDISTNSEQVVFRNFNDSPFTWNQNSSRLLVNIEASQIEIEQHQKRFSQKLETGMPAIVSVEVSSKTQHLEGGGMFPIFSNDDKHILGCIRTEPIADSAKRPKLSVYKVDSVTGVTRYKGLSDLLWDPTLLHRPLALFGGEVLLYSGSNDVTSSDGVNYSYGTGDRQSISLKVVSLPSMKSVKLITINESVSACSFGLD